MKGCRKLEQKATTSFQLILNSHQLSQGQIIAPAGRIVLPVHTGEVTQPAAASRSCSSCRNQGEQGGSSLEISWCSQHSPDQSLSQGKLHHEADCWHSKVIAAQADSWDRWRWAWCWGSSLCSLSQHSAVTIWCFPTLSLTRAVFKTLAFSLEKLRFNSTQNGSNLQQNGTSERRLALGLPSKGAFTNH